MHLAALHKLSLEPGRLSVLLELNTCRSPARILVQGFELKEMIDSGPDLEK